jgi:hypothetical protein
MQKKGGVLFHLDHKKQHFIQQLQFLLTKLSLVKILFYGETTQIF